MKRNGDLKIEGEITQYSQRNKSVSSEGYAAQTELSVTVNVRFTNNKNHKQDFEQQFTSAKTYDGSALTQPRFTASALEANDSHVFTVAMTAASPLTNAGTQANVIATVANW